MVRFHCRGTKDGARVRFMSVALQEPPKDFVLAYQPGDAIDRQAFMVLMDNATAKTYEAKAAPMGPANPYGNAFYSTATLLANELSAQRIVDPFAGRYWKIINPDRTNQMGEPVGYKLMPGENILPFAHP